MDSTTIMDPELASEMVKLLAQELKVVRAQLREAEWKTSTTPCTGDPSNRITHEGAQALIADNDSLKVDNAALQKSVARLQDELAQASSIKLEQDVYNPLQYVEMSMPHTREDLARLPAENQVLVREKTSRAQEEASRNQEKLSVLQDKHRRTKAKVQEYDEILNELRVALSNCIQELEQSKKAVVSEIDFRHFLTDSPYEPVEGQIELSSIQPYHTGSTKLRKDLMDVCKGPYFIHVNEVIWSPSGIALGLVVKPTFEYNPKICAWIKIQDDFDVGKQLDICLRTGNTLRYLGTYERVGDQSNMIIAPESLEYLDQTKLDHVSKRTTLFPDLVPPSQTRMITTMYKQGVIKLQGLGIRRVAFNQTFSEKLRSTHTHPVRQDQSTNTTSIPTPGITRGSVRKRKQDAKLANHPTKNRKREH